MPKKANKKTAKMKTPLNHSAYDDGGDWMIELDVPGTTTTDLKVTVEADTIRVSGKRNGVPYEQVLKFDDRKYNGATAESTLDGGVLYIIIEGYPAPPVVNVPITVVTGSV